MCLAIGCPHPDYLLRLLTSRQLSEWRAYFDIRPFGQDYSDYLTAQQLAQFHNANKKSSAEAVTPEDFLPKKEQTPDEMRLALKRVLSGNR